MSKSLPITPKPSSLDPENVHFYYNRGIAYLWHGEYARAIADLDEALCLNPDDAQAYGARGYAYYGQGDFELAVASLSEAIRLDPGDAKAYRFRGMPTTNRVSTSLHSPT